MCEKERHRKHLLVQWGSRKREKSGDGLEISRGPLRVHT